MQVPELTIYGDGVSQVSGAQLNTFIQGCQSFAQLRSLTGVSGMQIWVGGGIAVADGLQGFFWWSATADGADDGIDVIQPTGGGATGRWLRIPSATTYVIAWEFMGGTPPVANEIAGMHVFATNVLIPPNFGQTALDATSAAWGQVLSDPGASFVLTAYKVAAAGGGPVAVGTMTISTAGAFAFATISQAGINFAPGDLIYWQAQSTPDISLANFAWTIVGAPTS